jgi:GNAT superfamily N-acetyltransferase
MILERTDFHKSSKETIHSMVDVTRTNASDNNFKNLVKELDSDLRARYNNFSYEYDANIQVDNLETVVTASIGDVTIGCGCFKEISADSVEIKRMFVNPYFRGLGVSSSILIELLDWAKELNYAYAMLETGFEQQESISLYKKHGFAVIKNFEPYVNIIESICMSKALE